MDTIENKNSKENSAIDIEKVQREILVEYLKLLREEIHLRLNRHYVLFVSKLASLATVSSFFILNLDKVEKIEYLPYFFYVLLPLLSIMFDFQIGYNLRWMNTISTFVRDKIERFFSENYGLQLYESQALSFNALLNRLVDIFVTGFMVGFCILKILTTPIACSYKVFAFIFIIILFLGSSIVLIRSTKGYQFK